MASVSAAQVGSEYRFSFRISARLMALRTLGDGGKGLSLVFSFTVLLILGLLFSAFESLNKDHTLAEEKTLDRSVCYRPMIRLADSLFPLLEWAKEQVSIDEQELWSDNSPER